MIDLNRFPMHKKPYSDHRLMSTSKRELVSYIRDIEHNYEALYDAYQKSIRFGESLYDKLNETVTFDEEENQK